MPLLSVYEQPEFPAIYKWQAIAFMRMQWASIFQGDNLYMHETYPPELQPVHFAMTEGDSLLSYGALLRLSLAHLDNEYSVYGFGNLLTFPPFRGRGYGGLVLERATQYIRQSGVDLGVLFCDPQLEAFYAAKSWTTTRTPTYLGGPESYELYEPLRMMLFVSEKATEHRADFEREPLYIESPW